MMTSDAATMIAAVTMTVTAVITTKTTILRSSVLLAARRSALTRAFSTKKQFSAPLAARLLNLISTKTKMKNNLR